MAEMRYGRIPQSNKSISRIVQGTAFLKTETKAEHFAYLDQIYERGCTAVDTGQSYGKGESERVLGEWMQSRNIRENIFVLSKCCHPTIDRDRVTPFDITADLHDSLARLRTDYIDLYLLHRDDVTKPVGPLVERFNQHIREGKILAYGGSNWTPRRIAEANDYAQQHGLVGFAASSPQFSLAAPAIEPWPGCLSIGGTKGTADCQWYQQEKMPLFVWSSLATGFFSGRFTKENRATFLAEETYWLDKVCAEAFCTDENFALLQRVTQLATEKKATLAQIAVAYVLNHQLQPFAVIGSRKIKEFTENLTAVSIHLNAQEIDWLTGNKKRIRPQRETL